MASYTTNLRLEKQTSGSNSGTWGDTLNEKVFDMIDQAVGGNASITLSSSNHALTTNDGLTDEARSPVINLTGTLSANVEVQCPDSVVKTYIVVNSTSVAYTVTFKTVSGSGVVIPQGDTMIIVSNGTNCSRGGLPIVTASGVVTSATITETSFTSGTVVSCSIEGSIIINTSVSGGTINSSTLSSCTFSEGPVSATAIVVHGSAYVSGASTLNAGVSVSGAAIGNMISQTAGGTDVTLDLDTSNYFTITMTGNVSLTTPSNPVVGQSGVIYLIQDGTGSRTAKWSSALNWPSGTTISCTPSINSVDLFSFFVRGTSDIDIVGTRDFKTG